MVATGCCCTGAQLLAAVLVERSRSANTQPDYCPAVSICDIASMYEIGLMDRPGRQHVNTLTKFASQTHVQPGCLGAVDTFYVPIM
jgi:hypothetical protein